ncbi:MAG: ATP-binding cassette domain-containing protein [Thermoleophilaceae bacterium]
MEGRREDGGERPLEPRDWEQTRGERQQEPHAEPTRVHEQHGAEPGGYPAQPTREQPAPDTREQPAPDTREQPAPETHEQPVAETREQAIHDEPGGPGSPEAMQEERGPGDGGTAAATPRGTGEMTHEPGSQAEADEYEWHTGAKREHGADDAVEFIDVVKAFGRNRVLNGLNLGLPHGQISMILGPSGTGKSVCIKHMVGLLYPDEGDVLVHGESVPNMADEELFEMRKKFGVLFQDGALFGSMNVYDNTAFPLRQHTDKSEDEIREIVTRRLGEVGLGAAAEKMPNELSGGMRKRAGFARALVLDPDIVLFDEPDSGLDPVRTALLCELIMEVHEENGGAYCVITHDIMSARRVADYIAILWKGRIVESGPASALFNSDNQFVRQFLSGEAQGPLGME